MQITNVTSRVDTNANNIVGTLFHWSTDRIQSTLSGLVINEKIDYVNMSDGGFGNPVYMMKCITIIRIR